MTTKQERGRFVRTKQRQKQPDFVRKAGPHTTRRSRRADVVSAIDEWADDLNGIHSIFED